MAGSGMLRRPLSGLVSIQIFGKTGLHIPSKRIDFT
jgi:hypothetical protein